MKKFFSIVAAALVSLSMFATDPVTIDFTQNPKGLTEQEQGDVITVTVSGVTVTCTKGTETNATAPILSLDMLKWYKWATLEVSSTVGNIKTIEFTESSSSYGLDRVVGSSVGTWNNPAWTGDAASVTFTNNNQIRLNKIVVYFEEHTPVVTTPDTITVSEVRTRIDASNNGKCYVYGRVVSIDVNYISQYNNVNCWLVDLENENDTIEGYKMKGANNANYTAETDLEYAVGDTVLFYASALKKYNTTYEINEGYFAELLGAGPNHGTVPTITMDTLTVAEAMTKGKALADNTESEKVCVIGYAVKLHASGYDATNGYQTVFMSDDPTATYGDFQAYKCDVAAPGVAQGDKVAVVGKILKYVGQSGDATIEIKSGKMEVISAAAFESVEDGAKATKVIENGQMVIIRNGVRFNAAGARL